MTYCSHCGVVVLDEAVVCPKCGCPAQRVNATTNCENKDWNGFALAGFIVSFYTVLVGLVLSIVGLCQVKRNGGNGKGFAIAGIVITTLKILLYISIWILLIWLSYIIERNGGL